MATIGRKDDAEKLRFDLLPHRAVTEIVEVLTLGAQRYGDGNWKQVPDHRRRYYAAALRHLFAWFRGERLDPDTKKSHLAHAGCCLLFLIERDDEQ